MTLLKDGSIQKFCFGFSQDSIAPSLANYKTNDSPIDQVLVKTTKVGSYSVKGPWGTYDMSRNVWNGPLTGIPTATTKQCPEKSLKTLQKAA